MPSYHLYYIWVSHPTRISEYRIATIRKEQKIGAEDLKCLLFAY